MQSHHCIRLSALFLILSLLFSAAAHAVRIEQSTWPLQENNGCSGENAAFCGLRIYQVMVESFIDGDPNHDYNDGYGTSHHKGDLRGIIQSLDYIKSLGMNAIWLTPVFDSDAGQPQARLCGNGSDLKLDATGYYTRDYFAIDPNFGTLDDARELVEEAHDRGLYVFFDGVFGHHKGNVAASPTGKLPVDSDDFDDYGGDPCGYPGRVVEFDDPRSVEFFKEVATWWIDEIGIDGWRLDQAYQVPLDAWREIRAAVEATSQARRDAGEAWGTLGYMVSEIFAGADDIQAQAFGPANNPALDSAFDFPLRWATVGVLAGEENPAQSKRPASTINESWAYGAHTSVYRPLALPNMMLGNHDFVRYGDLLQRADIAEPGNPEYWRRHELAFMVQGAYTGPITRYYGEELGDEVPGYANQVTQDCANQGLCDDHVARTSAKVPGVSIDQNSLSQEQNDLIAAHKQIMRLRRMLPALSHGARQHLYSDAALYVDLKSWGDQRLVFAMNVSGQDQVLELNQDLLLVCPECDNLVRPLRAIDVMNGDVFIANEGYIEVNIPALSGRYLLMNESALTRLDGTLNDAWFNADTAGQGYLFTVLPTWRLMFLSWFTFDGERPAPETPVMIGSADHRWLTALGEVQGNQALLDIEVTSGGVFDASDPEVKQAPGGVIRVEFHDCGNATLHYELDDPPLESSVPITRIADNVELCENQPDS